ncbi:hypothetical protein CLU79DRAFT_704881, partial [Phycomyces nitens]
PNKVEKTVLQTRPDFIASTLVQLKFGTSLGHGRVKPRNDSTTIQSLCVDTIELVVLSRNATQLSLQVNGKIHQKE